MPPRRRHVTGPILLLSVGILLLLNNLDIVPWSIWRDLWPYWPVLLVLLGIEAFVTGRVAWGTLVLLILLLPLVGLAVSVGSIGSRWNEATRAAPDRVTSTVHQTLNGASSASASIGYGVGALDVGPLPAGSGDDVLVDGQVFGHGPVGFDTRYDVSNGRGTLRIMPRQGGGPTPPSPPNPLGPPGPPGPPDPVGLDAGRLALRFAPNVPLDLELNTGATDMTLNLADLQVSSLTIQTGASRGRVVLPARGQTTARIEGGASSLTLEVPPGVAARIMLDDAPNSIQIDQARFPKVGSEYRSPDFDGAANRVTVRANVGASRLVVQ